MPCCAPTSPACGTTINKSMACTDLLFSLVPAATGLLGAWLSGYWASRNQRKERAERWISDQLTGFCAPMIGPRERLGAKNKVRLKISGVANKTWQQTISGGIPQEERDKYDKSIEYDNQQLIIDAAEVAAQPKSCRSRRPREPETHSLPNQFQASEHSLLRPSLALRRDGSLPSWPMHSPFGKVRAGSPDITSPPDRIRIRLRLCLQ
jgi:hypothetical protein